MPTVVQTLAEEYAARFKPARSGPRLIGRELEFPLVNHDGTAGDIRRLWPRLMREDYYKVKYDDPATESLIVALHGDGVVYEAEVGLGTVELLTPACADLFELEAAARRGLAPLVRAAEAEGMHVLGFGIQPRTPRTASLMTPKKRYGALLKAIGTPWLHFATTAADQLHVDITRGELVPVLNWMNLLSAPLIALCANSSVYAGRAGRFASGREGLLGTIGMHRNGMTPRKFASLAEFVEFICAHPCYVLKQPDGSLTRYNRPFSAWLAKHGADLDAYLWHEHYTWNSARARVEHSTIEVRPACQQPPDEMMAASALSLGLVEALPQLAEYVTRALGADPWPVMLRYRAAVVQAGVRAPEPAPRFLHHVVQAAADGLRARGRGEERFLEPIWSRLQKRRAPADEARARFQKGGIQSLLDYCTFIRNS